MDNIYDLKRVTWEITLRCNLKCIHCGSSAENNQGRENELCFDECVKVIDDLVKLNVEHITLSGGEPFLCDFWENLAKYIVNKNIKLGIVTNGTLINSKIINILTHLPITPEIGISIDGNSKIHDEIRGIAGSFEKSIKSLKNLIDNNIPCSVITSVSKKNFLSLQNIYDILKSKKIYTWQIQAALPIGRMSNNKDLILDEDDFIKLVQFIVKCREDNTIKVKAGDNLGYYCSLEHKLRDFIWKGCSAGISTIDIKSNGDVTGCLALQNIPPEGNIRNRSIIDIWKDNSLFLFNRNFKKENLKGKCKLCKFGTLCKGGCSALSSCYSGEFRNNIMCTRINQMLIDDNIVLI